MKKISWGSLALGVVLVIIVQALLNKKKSVA